MNAILKLSGVPAQGLSGLHSFLSSEPLGVEEQTKKPGIVLKDVRLEEGKTTYLVTLELLLVDETSTPRNRMRRGLLMKLIRSIDFRLLPVLDAYADAERNLEELKTMLGKLAPFEVTDRKTGYIILQKGQPITQSRLEELVALPLGTIDWSEPANMDENTAFFDMLLWWMYEGGVRNCEFNQYRKQ